MSVTLPNKCSTPLERQKSRKGTLPCEESYWTTRCQDTIEFARAPGCALCDDGETCVCEAGFDIRSSGLSRRILSSSSTRSIVAGPQTSLAASTLTLVLTSVGSGVFALPFAFSHTGAGCGAVLATVMAALSWLSGYAMCRCSHETERFSYEEIVVAAWGRGGAFFMELMIIIVLLGAMTAMVTLIIDALPAAAQLVLPWINFDDLEAYCKTSSASVVLAFVLLPLSCVRSMSSLKHSNTVAVVCVLSVVAFVAIRGAQQITDGGGLLAFRPAFTGADRSLQALPILMLSYCMHVQAPAVYGEMERRSVPRFAAALGMQTTICLVVYLSIGVFGLRLFGPDEPVPGDVLLGLEPGSQTVLAMRAIVGLSCIFVFPLLSLPCRSTIDHLLFAGGNAAAEGARMRHTAVAAVLVAVVLLGAKVASNLGKVTAITGATGGALLCYVIPFMLFLKLCTPKAGSERWIFSFGLACAIVFMALALFSVARNLF